MCYFPFYEPLLIYKYYCDTSYILYYNNINILQKQPNTRYNDDKIGVIPNNINKTSEVMQMQLSITPKIRNFFGYKNFMDYDEFVVMMKVRELFSHYSLRGDNSDT